MTILACGELDYWNRNYVPWPDEILVDNCIAMMSQRAFDRLPEYSTTGHPLNEFIGQRWKFQQGRFVSLVDAVHGLTPHQQGKWFMGEIKAHPKVWDSTSNLHYIRCYREIVTI